ncbi:MAG: hypothetical protein PUD80_08480 [Firmicutes bacterium]|nr:hypothetical protein [Bacillota bacterium]
MREFEVRLQSVLDVQEFVSLATARPFAVGIGDGSNQVNGKSFMEMFCLDLRRPLRVVVDCCEEEFERFCEDAGKFLVK